MVLLLLLLILVSNTLQAEFKIEVSQLPTATQSVEAAPNQYNVLNHPLSVNEEDVATAPATCPEMVIHINQKEEGSQRASTGDSLHKSIPVDLATKDGSLEKSDQVKECGIMCANEEDDFAPTLDCGHNFHMQCIRPWLLTSEKSTCPDCRKDVSAQLFQDITGQVLKAPQEAEMSIVTSNPRISHRPQDHWCTLCSILFVVVFFGGVIPSLVF
ncbi:hypothetical protein PGT21_012534 [Puccinia graminis f. sp. tritici]|uniref:RING-type domain-containing protein n=1 Tax=Puccinia graminis f. sp. tritici TaxID=56615 RepID=A0A5B0LLC9_PUCGR|nr:hypothetical protein PGT21_012534 [Puccinia graminis f. sp. tritici]